MQTIVISLGGSIIAPNKINYKFLEEFKKAILNNKKYKFIIICGGGKTARNYIEAARKEHLTEKEFSILGIMATRMNAELVQEILKLNNKLPITQEEVLKLKQRIIVCGALGNRPKMTSDANAAELSQLTKAKCFINMTNVSGLYTKDPNKYKNAKLIKEITFKDFNEKIKKIKYEAGQHFVLDQKASKIIMENHILTYIIQGNNNLNKILNNKEFIGTIIS
mgnify:CR=1 FL=1